MVGRPESALQQPAPGLGHAVPLPGGAEIGLGGCEACSELAVDAGIRTPAQMADEDRSQAGVLRALDHPLDAPVIGPVGVKQHAGVPLGLRERVPLLHVAARAHPQLEHQLQPVPRPQRLQAAVHRVCGAPKARCHVDRAGVPGARRPVLALDHARGTPGPGVHDLPRLPHAGVQDGPQVLYRGAMVCDRPLVQDLLSHLLRGHDVQLRPPVWTVVRNARNGLDDVRAKVAAGYPCLLAEECRFKYA
mmetsp:Transcript_15418/g.31282  ORF Transcript_15418/g.31282 Transcript_15418/m.31282 type:complete len:247 (-) Transcript_15418:520-1260(-)